ncbi:MAG: hypothetical protein EB062_02815 [Actinobacteria bacterium]|nr:hypothetical protein [Actinomycetota bacterium]
MARASLIAMTAARAAMTVTARVVIVAHASLIAMTAARAAMATGLVARASLIAMTAARAATATARAVRESSMVIVRGVRRAEVFHRKGGRKYGKDNPVISRRQNDDRQVIDEGSVRTPRERDTRRNERRAADERTRDKRAVDRRNRDDRRDGRHQFSPPRALEEKLAKEVRRAVGERRFAYVSRQVGAALDAYDRERWRDASKLLAPLLEDLYLVLDVRVIAGRVEYKLQRWRAAAEHLEFARAGDPTDMTNMPVLIDCYRALRQYDMVDQLWEEMKLVSPHPMVMAEGRVSTAGSYADRGDLQSAIRIMTHGGEPSHVQPHHVLEWYVLADLHDRAGDPVTAKRLFAKVAKADAEFYDVTARLAALGDE